MSNGPELLKTSCVVNVTLTKPGLTSRKQIETVYVCESRYVMLLLKKKKEDVMITANPYLPSIMFMLFILLDCRGS